MTVRHVNGVIVAEVPDEIIDRLDTQTVGEISHALNVAIAEMLSIVRLDHILDICEDQQIAMDSFSELEPETKV